MILGYIKFTLSSVMSVMWYYMWVMCVPCTIPFSITYGPKWHKTKWFLLFLFFKVSMFNLNCNFTSYQNSLNVNNSSQIHCPYTCAHTAIWTLKLESGLCFHLNSPLQNQPTLNPAYLWLVCQLNCLCGKNCAFAISLSVIMEGMMLLCSSTSCWVKHLGSWE